MAQAQTSPGLWEIRGLPNAGTSVRQCVSNTALLARVEHQGQNCKQVVISDNGTSTVIDYTCANGGFGRSRWSGDGSNDGGWHDSPVSYGELSRLVLELPDGGQRPVPSVRLDPYGAAVWLSDTPEGDELSPSLAWFAALTRFAVDVVRSGVRARRRSWC